MGWLGTGPVAMGWCLLPAHLQMVTEPGLFGSSAPAPGLPAGSGLLRCAGLFPGSAYASLEGQAGFFSGVLRGTTLHDSFLADPSPSKGAGLLGSRSYFYQLYMELEQCCADTALHQRRAGSLTHELLQPESGGGECSLSWTRRVRGFLSPSPS